VGVLALAAIVQTPTFTPHIPLKAGDFSTFIHALLQLLAWPVKTEFGGFPVGVVVVYTPLALYTLAALRDAAFRTPGHYFVLAVGAWVVGQILLMAYGRGSFHYLAARYLDTYAVGLLAGFAALLALAGRGKFHWYKPLLVLLWLGAVLFGLSGNRDTLKWHLNRLSHEAEAQEQNVRNYLLTGDRTYLVGKPEGEIPFFNAELLVRLLDDPQIRVFLPSNIYRPGTAYDEIPNSPDGSVTR